MRSGYVDNGAFDVAGLDGYDWTTTVTPRHGDGSVVPSAYFFAATNTGVLPSAGPNYRRISLPLRCLTIKVLSGQFCKNVNTI